MTMAEAEDLWFRIDTGIDRDGDGDSLIDVDYPMIRATGEYKIPVYQYDAPFVFTEHNADVPGYTRTTTITVSGEHITGSSQSGDSVTVTMEPVYQGENVHLGTVTYTNSYTKNVGTPVQVYPTLTLLKSAADTRLAQDGVEFTLYSDADGKKGFTFAAALINSTVNNEVEGTLEAGNRVVISAQGTVNEEAISQRSAGKAARETDNYLGFSIVNQKVDAVIRGARIKAGGDVMLNSVAKANVKTVADADAEKKKVSFVASVKKLAGANAS